MLICHLYIFFGKVSIKVFGPFFFGCVWVFLAACKLFSNCGEWGLLFIAACGLLTAVASLVVEHGL